MKQISFSEGEFQELFRLHYKELMKFVCAYLRDREAAQDIVHDTFLTVWNNRRQLDASYSLKYYLFRIARNYTLDYLKHRRVVEMNSREFAAYLNEPAEDFNTMING